MRIKVEPAKPTYTYPRWCKNNECEVVGLQISPTQGLIFLLDGTISVYLEDEDGCWNEDVWLPFRGKITFEVD